MEWDAVERELFIIASQLRKVATSLGALAVELHKERKAATHGVTRGASGDETDDIENQDGPQAQSEIWD